MFYIISYDIRDDRRRKRVHKTLKGFGENVQESVFEAIVDGQQFQQMKQKVQHLIREHDKVRYYYLCEKCQQKMVGTPGHPSALLWPRLIL